MAKTSCNQTTTNNSTQRKDNSKNMKTKYRNNRKRNNKTKQNNLAPKFNAEEATNNPQWYGADTSLLRDSASLPFSYAVGMPIDLHNPALTQLPGGQKFSIPGFMALRLKPSVGFSNDAGDPINVAAFRMYTFVRHLNSGHVNYDAPDLMIYILAMSQVYSYINFLQRAYGLVYTYSQKNRYLPDALLKAMGIDAQDVRENLASFRYGINVLINKAASLCVPSTMYILSRHSSVYQNIYIEGDSLKDQMYFYTPDSFWKFTLNIDSSGMLEDTKFYEKNKYYKVSELLDYGTDMLARLIMSEDMNIMSGDIRKAYGDNIIKLQPLQTDFPITPIFDHAVLQQIKNSVVIDYTTVGFDVAQENGRGFLVHQPEARVARTAGDWYTGGTSYMLQGLLEDKLLSVASADPTPEEIIESSRNIPSFSNFVRSDTMAQIYIHPCADVVVGCNIYYFVVVSDIPTLKSLSVGYMNTPNAESTDSQALTFKTMSYLGHFKYHPMMHVVPLRSGSTSGSFNYTDANLCFDVDNYTILNSTTIERMNETALLSMLNVPVVAKVQ